MGGSRRIRRHADIRSPAPIEGHIDPLPPRPQRGHDGSPDLLQVGRRGTPDSVGNRALAHDQGEEETGRVSAGACRVVTEMDPCVGPVGTLVLRKTGIAETALINLFRRGWAEFPDQPQVWRGGERRRRAAGSPYRRSKEANLGSSRIESKNTPR